ncbi:hypothetical protein ACOMHN_044176 [Nucella lapillus]
MAPQTAVMMRGGVGALLLWATVLYLLFLTGKAKANCNYNKDADQGTWFVAGGLYYAIYEKCVRFREAQRICSCLPYFRLAVFDNISSREDVDAFLRKRYKHREFWIDAERREADETSSSATVGPNTSSVACGEQHAKYDNATLKHDNMTREGLQEMVMVIRAYLTVNKSLLSSTLRKKTSAQDNRLSAQATGYAGLLILLILLFSIVILDLISALQSVINNKKVTDIEQHEGVKTHIP